MDAAPVRVTILGQNYTLRAQGDPKEVEDLARSVDELMHNIARKSPNADTTRIAVMSCLHLADQLSTLERELGDLKARVGRKTEEFAGLLEKALEGE
ncbi:MAG: cell division protein ZapA [Bryobacteraceae bacterium]